MKTVCMYARGVFFDAIWAAAVAMVAMVACYLACYRRRDERKRSPEKVSLACVSLPPPPLCNMHACGERVVCIW